ncbi:MAG: DNA-binding transcriptional regulator [Kiritimatiellia bacterium]
MKKHKSANSNVKHVALVLSLNKRFDRKVIEGVTRFVLESGKWSVFLEDDPGAKIPNFKRGHFDGVIADMDDQRIPQQIKDLAIPVVGIGGIKSDSPLKLKLSTVGTDNRKIAVMAAEYLINFRLKSFGYCGIVERTIDPWNQERRESFVERLVQDGYKCSIFKGRYKSSQSWEQLQEAIFNWINSLPKPVGIFAANDTRARHILEACRCYGVPIPDDVALLGVDNDELICELATPSLSSIIQGTEEIGYSAAKLLDRLMDGREKKLVNLLVAPVKIVERGSTDMVATDNSVISNALIFIRKNAVGGLSVSQVAQGIGVSRSTLDSHFKKVIGRSVHAEILRVQLNAACHLLAATDMSLENIAKRVGFCHAQYLSNVFRVTYGQTPGEYRQRAR